MYIDNEGDERMRKLVSIQEVKEVNPIENADAIEVVKVLGWSVVTKKGEFKKGDKVVYAEIDSLFPEKEEFEFLRNSKFRIRTVKLRGQVSQGICFPLSILPKGNYKIGDDVTEIIGVTKYEPPIPACLSGKMKGPFPSFIQKTDETRIQNLQERLTKFKGTKCVYSEKLDGTSSTFYINNGEFGVCSKNLELHEDEDNTFWQIAKRYNIESKLRSLGKNVAIQGETIGTGIQNNKYKLEKNERDLYLFNIFDIDNYSYLGYEDFIELADKLELKTVPFIDLDFTLTDDIDYLVELSKGVSKLNNKVKREGIVIKSYEEINDMGERVSFKSINPDFLIKYKE